MMHIGHLLWIVPMAAAVGLMTGCCLSAAAREDDRMRIRDKKNNKGR